MVTGSAWKKNNRRELKKTLGRFLAIVSIVALGISMFVGLKSAKPSMVKTCNVYLNDTDFYDLQLLSSIAFDLDAPADFQSMDGIRAAEGGISADMLARMGDNEVVFKTHSLTSSVNRIHLTGGRMPRTSFEVLADDLAFSEKDLGTVLTVEHQEDSVFSQDTYTIVGLCNSPQYLNMSRGTTALGTGSVIGFLFIPQEGYDTDYYTELYLRLDGSRNLFDQDYLDALLTWEDPLLNVMERQGKARLDSILLDARKELGDGWQQYYDGLIEFEKAKAEVEAELADAEQQLADARQQLEDGRKELENGEATLLQLQTNPYSNPQLAEAKAQLEDARKQLEDGKAQYTEGLSQYESMAGPVKLLITTAENALKPAQKALEDSQVRFAQAEAAFEEAAAYLKSQHEALYAPVAQLEASVQEAQAELDARQAELDQLQQNGGSILELSAATMAVQAAQAELQTRQLAYGAAKSTYDTQAQLLQAQLDTTRSQMEAAKAVLDRSQATVDQLTKTIQDGEKQLEDAKVQLLEAKVQIEEGEAQLAEGEAALQQGIVDAIAMAQTQLAEGRTALEEGQAEYEKGLQELEDGKAEAKKELADAEKELKSAHRDLQQAELDLKRMNDPSYYVMTPTSNNGFISFDNDTNIVDAIATVFPVFFFLVAALVCSSTMSRMVEEQRTQNGTLKALGYSDGQIMMRYASYAGTAAIIGTVIGVLLGNYLFPFVIWEAYKILYHFGELEYLFSWGLTVISLAAALLCCCGAACMAAWTDLQLMPAQLMRPKTPKAGKRIFLEYIKPLWNNLGFLAKVSLRNIFRYKKRLFMMLLGTGGCLALLLTGLGLRDSISNVADDQFGQITMYDYILTFTEHQTEAEREAFREEFRDDLDHCVFISTSALDVPISSGTKSVSIVACSDPAIDEILGLFMDGQDLGYPSGSGMYISHSLAEDAGLKIGDSLPIQLESKDLIEVPITGIFTNYVSHYAFLTEEGYKTWFGIEPEIKSAYVSTSGDLYAVNAALQKGEGVLNVTMVQDLKDMVANAVGSLDAIIILVVACATALAFVVGYNLININITERVREIATIKVLGFYRNETHAYVFRESILLTIMGTIVGVPLGIWLHRFVMSVVKVDFVCFQVQIAPLSFAIGIAITLLVTIIVDRLLSKKIDRINMAESLKSVE